MRGRASVSVPVANTQERVMHSKRRFLPEHVERKSEKEIEELGCGEVERRGERARERESERKREKERERERKRERERESEREKERESEKEPGQQKRGSQTRQNSCSIPGDPYTLSLSVLSPPPTNPRPRPPHPSNPAPLHPRHPCSFLPPPSNPPPPKGQYLPKPLSLQCRLRTRVRGFQRPWCRVVRRQGLQGLQGGVGCVVRRRGA